MKWVQKGLPICISLSILTICLFCSVVLPTFQLSFYRYEYEKYQIPEKIKIKKQDLLQVTKHLLDYMWGSETDLAIQAEINGQNRLFFNQREKQHMVDVKELFQGGKRLFFGAFAILCVSTVLLYVLNDRRLKITLKQIAISNLFVTGIFLFFLIGTAIVVAMDFTHSFQFFHQIFFTNDLWILNPETDLLINIVPEPFFKDIALVIAVIFVLFMILSTGLSLGYLKKIKGDRL